MMNKCLYLTIIMVLALAFSANAAGNLSIATGPVLLTGDVGDAPSGIFTIQNSGTGNLSSIVISAPASLTGTNSNVDISATPNSITQLITGEAQNISYSIVLNGNPFAEVYTGTINVTSNEAGSYDSYPVSVQVNATNGVTATNPSVTIVEGESSSVILTLTASGNTDESVTLTKTNLTSSGQADIDSSEITFGSGNPIAVNYGESVNVTVDVSVPLNITTGDRAYTAKLPATYTGGQTNATLTVNVQDRDEVVTISSQTMELVSGYDGDKIFNLTFKNDGNVNITDAITLDKTTPQMANGTSVTSVTLQSSITALYTDQNATVVPYRVYIGTDQPVGTYTGYVSGTYGKDNVPFNKTITVQVKEKTETMDAFDISPVSLVRTGGASTEARFKLKNTGTVPLTVSFDKTKLFLNENNSISASNVAIPSSTTIEPATETEVAIVVTLPNTNIALGTYVGNITANYATNKSITKTLSVSLRSPVGNIGFSPSTFVFDESGRNVTVGPKKLTIMNTGSSGDRTLGSFNVSRTGSTSYNVTFATSENGIYKTSLGSTDLASLAPGNNHTIWVKAYVPRGASGGETDIGNIVVKSDYANRTLETFRIDVQNKLSIDYIDFNVDGDSNKVTTDGGTADDSDATLGEGFEVKIKVVNGLSNSKMEDVEIDAVIYGEDDFDDIDGEVRESFTISDDNYKVKRITFDKDKIPTEARDQDYEMKVDVVGYDENNAKHTASWTIKVRFHRNNHEIVIDKFEFRPEEVRCGDTTFLTLTGKNLGTSHEDEVVLRVKSASSSLNIDSVDEFELGTDADDDCNAVSNPEDECYEFRKSYTIQIPTGFKSGTYKVTANVYRYRDTNSAEYTATAELKVLACDDEPEEIESDEDDVEVHTGSGFTDDIISGGLIGDSLPAVEVTETSEGTFKNSGAYVALLILANIVVIGLAILLVFKFLLTKA